MTFAPHTGFRVRGSGFGIRDSGFGVRGSEFGVRSSGFGVRGSGLEVTIESAPKIALIREKIGSWFEVGFGGLGFGV